MDWKDHVRYGNLLLTNSTSQDRQVICWNTYKGEVNQVLCEKRNNVNGAVKNSFIGKFIFLKLS